MRHLLCLLLCCSPLILCAQDFNSEKTTWDKYVTRMYLASPFEGVRLVEDTSSIYLISVVSLDASKYGSNKSAMYRVSSVKAMSQASRFFNGSKITSDLIIKTTESAQDIKTEIIEYLSENSTGFIKKLSLSSSFQNKEGMQVFIYYCPIQQ